VSVAPKVRLGLRDNIRQFSLLVAVTAFVGAMVGLERSTLPLIGRDDFGLGSSAAVLSFIVAFGLAKSFTNLGAGAFASRVGRRRLLIAGWVAALPVPLLVATAPSWAWVVVANVLLGVNQGLAWSMTVVMKIDLVGPRRRGFALGLNEAAGYAGVAAAAAASGWLASQFAARDVLVIGGAVVAVIALALCVLFVRDTAGHVELEQTQAAEHETDETPPRTRDAFRQGSYRQPALRSCSQAGLVNNLNDALAWGLVPLFLAEHGASDAQIGLVAGLYPAVWGVGQIWTGHWSDRVGRKPLIVAGMLLQATALAVLAASNGRIGLAVVSAVALGAGTALVYPTLIAAISDAVSPIARASMVGVYRFWRDMGYVAGGLIAGLAADALGFGGAIAIVAGLTALSGLWVAGDMPSAASGDPIQLSRPATRAT
jgi:MFS family permease